jgi:hypothetical protein
LQLRNDSRIEADGKSRIFRPIPTKDSLISMTQLTQQTFFVDTVIHGTQFGFFYIKTLHEVPGSIPGSAMGIFP